MYGFDVSRGLFIDFVAGTLAADGVTALTLLGKGATLRPADRGSLERIVAAGRGGRASTTKSGECGARVRGAGRREVCTPTIATGGEKRADGRRL